MKENRRGSRWTKDEDELMCRLWREGRSLWKASRVLKRTEKAVMLRSLKRGMSFSKYATKARSRRDDQPDLPLEFDGMGNVKNKPHNGDATGTTTISVTSTDGRLRKNKMKKTSHPVWDYLLLLFILMSLSMAYYNCFRDAKLMELIGVIVLIITGCGLLVWRMLLHEKS